MFTRILTELERQRLKRYLKADGDRESTIRALHSRANRHMPRIREDLELLEQLLRTYGRQSEQR